jgi:hypothetical protein
MSDTRNQDDQPTDEAAEQPAAPGTTDADAPDGGPGSHNEGGTGGTTNDPASGGVPEEANEDSGAAD